MALKGLAAIGKFQKEQEERRAAQENRVKVTYFKFPKGKTTATVRFLQEFDEAATNYNADRGLALVQIEHEPPGAKGYLGRHNCTKESQEACYACERRQADFDNGGKTEWTRKTNLYINALVSFDGEAPVPMVIAKSYNASFSQSLIQEAIDENTVTDGNYRVTKTGEGTSTQWLLKKLRGEPFDDSESTVFDIEENVLREFPYDEQATKWYSKHMDNALVVPGNGDEPAEDQATEQRVPSDNNDW